MSETREELYERIGKALGATYTQEVVSVAEAYQIFMKRRKHNMSEKKEVKPGYSTTEFAVVLVTIVTGVLVALGVPESSPVVRVAGLVVTGFAASVYAWARTKVKSGAGHE